jgi:type IV pilus assembly protein PilM
VILRHLSKRESENELMDAHSVVWGLDIGHTSIKATKVSKTGETVSVLGYVIEPIASGDDVDRDEAVVNALQGLATREEIGATPVVAGLSGRQIFARTINIPIINPKKVDKMVELEARQQIPGNFDEVRWGYHLSPSIDGASYDVALFACRNEIIDDLIAKTKQAGLNLVGISVTSLAVYNYVQYDQDFQDEETVIVLDVGAENTDLVVYQGDTLWMRNLSVSGNDITRAFQKKFRVSFEEAEQLKCQVGESRQADKIFKVIEGSLGELVSDAQRSLGFYKSTNPDANFECCVVSGNTFRLPNLTQYMADRLGYAIITLVEMERIQIDPNLERDHFLEDLQSLGTSVGLGLQGLGVAKANVNLLPSSLRIQSLLKSKRWAAIAILVIIPIAFIINHLTLQGRFEENNRLTRRIEAFVKDVNTKEKAANAIIQRIPKVSQQISPYETYASHVGTQWAVETAIFSLVEELAQDRALVGEQPPLEEGGDPVLQPVYFERLEVPNSDANGVDAFKPLSRDRSVRVVFRVPSVLDTQEISARLRVGLSNLRVSSTMWRAHHPGRGASAIPEELPRLFKSVEYISAPPARDYYYRMDPDKIDADGNPAPLAERQERREFAVQKLTFTCVLGPIQDLEGGF